MSEKTAASSESSPNYQCGVLPPEFTIPEVAELEGEQLEKFKKDMLEEPTYPNLRFSVVDDVKVRKELKMLRNNPKKMWEEYSRFPWSFFFVHTPRLFFPRNFTEAYPTSVVIVSGLSVLQVYTATRLVMFREFEEFADRIDKHPVFIYKMDDKKKKTLKQLFFKAKEKFLTVLYMISSQYQKLTQFSDDFDFFPKRKLNVLKKGVDFVKKSVDESGDNLLSVTKSLNDINEVVTKIQKDGMTEMEKPERQYSDFVLKSFTQAFAERFFTDWVVHTEFMILRLQLIMENLMCALEYKEDKNAAILKWRLKPREVPNYQLLKDVDKILDEEVYGEMYFGQLSSVFKPYTERIRIIFDPKTIQQSMARLKNVKVREDEEKIKISENDKNYDETKKYTDTDSALPPLSDADKNELKSGIPEEYKKQILEAYEEGKNMFAEGKNLFAEGISLDANSLSTGVQANDIEAPPLILTSETKPTKEEEEEAEATLKELMETRQDTQKTSEFLFERWTKENEMEESYEKVETNEVVLDQSTISKSENSDADVA